MNIDLGVAGLTDCFLNDGTRILDGDLIERRNGDDALQRRNADLELRSDGRCRI